MATLSKDSLSFGELSVTADGVKKTSQLLAELGALLVTTGLGRLKESSYVILGNERQVFRFNYRTSQGMVYFSCEALHSNELMVENVFFDLVNEPYAGKYIGYSSTTNTITDYSNSVPHVGDTYTIHF